MKKFCSIQIGCLWLMCLLLPFAGNSQGFLKTDGTDIVNENGEVVIWRGVGLGGWMLQEGYMLKTAGPQYKIEERIEALIGKDRKEEFYDAWLANHMQKVDVDSMASWGFNSIRLPMHYKLFTPPIEEEPEPGEITWIEKGFEMTDLLLEWCKANNMYLILDLHAAPGGQGENADINDYDPSKPSLWESEANEEKMIALWRKLAERYADEPMIGGYDIINEPNWGFTNHAGDPNGCSESKNEQLWDLQRRVIEAIREVDQNHIVIIEGNCWGNNYNGLPAQLWDDNLVISFHKYWNSNDPNAIQGMINLRNNHNVPLYLGESGENSNTWFTDAISLMEENGVGWAWWPLKKIGINNPLEIKPNADYQRVIDWRPGQTKPDPEEAYQALMQFTEDIKLENNIYHKDVVDAMIRQPHSMETIPFKDHIISSTSNTIIYATDYDLGRAGIAYHDAESANTTGNAGGLAWNQGYSYRNDGVDIEACEDEETNGYNVGWTETGEWIQYTVTVEEEGVYTIGIRTASSGSAGKVSLSSNGYKITESIALPNTGGYQVWETTTVEDVYLKSGQNVLRINMDVGGFNLNYLEFSKQASPASEQPKILDGSINHGEKVINLVFNQPFEPIPDVHGFTVKVNGEEVDVEAVNLMADEDQIIHILLSEPVVFGDNVTLSYSGTEVTSAAGAALAAFADQAIEILTAYQVFNVPGRIKMEYFAVNNGFEFETSGDTNGGQNAGHTNPGDYLDFWVMVEKDGYYKPELRIAALSASGGVKLQLVKEEEIEELGAMDFASTGGWQTWKTMVGDELYLTAGLHTLRVLATKANFNINWLNLAYLYEEAPTPPLGINDLTGNPDVVIYPNPSSSGNFQIKFNDSKKVPSELTFYDLRGRKLLELHPEKGRSEYVVEHTLSKGLCYVVYKIDGRRWTQKLIIN